MKTEFVFVGRAEALTGRIQSVTDNTYDLLGTGPGRVAPNMGDFVRLPLLDAGASVTLLCVRRVFVMDASTAPTLVIELDEA